MSEELQDEILAIVYPPLVSKHHLEKYCSKFMLSKGDNDEKAGDNAGIPVPTRKMNDEAKDDEKAGDKDDKAGDMDDEAHDDADKADNAKDEAADDDDKASDEDDKEKDKNEASDADD